MIAIDRQYLTWLYSLVDDRKGLPRRKSYWKLAEELYTKEFIWFIPNDDNRNAEGIELRKVFLKETRTPYPDYEWMRMSSSMLELLIGLSHRLAFLDDRPISRWFWELLDNVGLTDMDDEAYDDDPELSLVVDDILDTIIWRWYDSDGEGGLFPLEKSHEDQRKVELWYQMSAYITEKMAEEWELFQL